MCWRVLLMTNNLSATERVNLEKELNDIMMSAEQTDDQRSLQKSWRNYGST